MLAVGVLDRWIVLFDKVTLDELDGKGGLTDTTYLIIILLLLVCSKDNTILLYFDGDDDVLLMTFVDRLRHFFVVKVGVFC